MQGCQNLAASKGGEEERGRNPSQLLTSRAAHTLALVGEAGCVGRCQGAAHLALGGGAKRCNAEMCKGL